MRSVFFRRLLIALIIAMLLAAAFMVAGYVFLSRDTYTGIKLEEMLPKAEAVKQLVTEYDNSQITPAAFDRMLKTLMKAANATAIITDESGTILHIDNTIQGLESQMIVSAVSGKITDVLSGSIVSADNVIADGYGELLVVGEPLTNADGTVKGAVIVVKSVQEIISATGKMSTSLFWIVAIVIPVIMLLTSWNVRRITDPLHKMSEAAIEMSKGNLDVRIQEENTVGETGVLARALNNLCESLSQTIYQLRLEKMQLDEILQSLTDGVAVTDGLGMLTHYNAALMRMFGAVNVEKRDELISDDLVWRAFDEVYISGKPQTITYPMAGEKTLWITVSPVVTESGERTGVVGLFKDMTEIERLENTRREYVANVSHELRTPLTAVRGLLEPLADGMVTSEEDRQRYYKIMLHEVMRLSRLITDMLTLSRLQSGTEYMELSRVDVDELVSDVASSYSATASQKGIDLIVDAPDAPDALTDPDRIEQVLIILLDNAMRYTPEGGKITITVRNGKSLLVSVSDTGCGIPEKDLPHIFERFYKVDKSRGEGGTGLGLSIAHYIIDKLDETITVDSVVGQGTCFTFSIKKYVSNAIALGPANEERYSAKNSESNPHADTSDKNSKKVIDASYEVIDNDSDMHKR